MEERGEVDISRSESVEHELNRLIERRHDQRTAEEWHKPSKELWQESVERYNAERDRQLRTEWTEYHRGQAVRLRAVLESLIRDHERNAEKYLAKGAEGEESTARRQRLARQGGNTRAYDLPRPRLRGVGEGARPCV
jgi:hypothetical protein